METNLRKEESKDLHTDGCVIQREVVWWIVKYRFQDFIEMHVKQKGQKNIVKFVVKRAPSYTKYIANIEWNEDKDIFCIDCLLLINNIFMCKHFILRADTIFLLNSIIVILLVSFLSYITASRSSCLILLLFTLYIWIYSSIWSINRTFVIHACRMNLKFKFTISMFFFLHYCHNFFWSDSFSYIWLFCHLKHINK